MDNSSPPVRSGERLSARSGAPLTTVRRLTADNVQEAAPVLRGRLTAVSSLSAVQVITACRRLLSAMSMMGILVDAADREGRDHVVAVGGAVFVSKRFVDEERATPRPGLADRIFASALNGEPAALPLRDIAAAAHSDGVCIAVALHDRTEDLPEEVELEIRHHLSASFVNDFRGYRILEIISELIGERDRMWAESGGFRVRSDYADWYRLHNAPLPRRAQVGISRDEGVASQGTLLSLMFHHTPPRFAFSSAQRRLLREAMQHKTDAEIAVALEVSLSAVKKTWAALFERASEIVDRSAAEDTDVPASRLVRGIQKRHRLLAYLIDHPQELRP
jgi:hypothetical protein